jgi:Mg2+ and Co2+ transporter CorA
MDGISNTGIRCSYGWLQRAEDSLSEIANSSHHTTETLIRLNKVEKDLLQVHKNVLQRKPKVNLQVVENFERTVAESVALDKPETSVEFKERLLQERRKTNGAIAFYKMKLKGIDTEVSDVMSRIQLLRSTIQNQLSVTLAVIQQDRDDKKHKATIHYSNNQQLFAALGVFFLPGTFFAVSSVREMICGSNRS